MQRQNAPERASVCLAGQESRNCTDDQRIQVWFESLSVDIGPNEGPFSKIITKLKYAVIFGRHVSQRFANGPTENWRELLRRGLLRQAWFIKAEGKIASDVRPLAALAPPELFQELIPRQVKDAFGGSAVKSIIVVRLAHRERLIMRRERDVSLASAAFLASMPVMNV